MGSSNVYVSPLGKILIREEDGRLCEISFMGKHPQRTSSDHNPSSFTNRCANELLEYLSGKRRVFDLPLAMGGTPFEQAVWKAVEAIPYGQTCTCTDIALRIGQPGCHRQVGRAAAACPLAPVVPTHRIETLDDELSVRFRALESNG